MVRSRKRSSSENAWNNKNKKSRTDDVLQTSGVFTELLLSTGYKIKTKNKPNEIGLEQSMFQRELSRALKRHADYPHVIEQFTDGLADVIADPVRLRWCLCASILPPEDDTGSGGGTQDSLLRLLLGIEELQPAVVTMLLEKLAEFTDDEDNVVEGEAVNLPRLLINQLRWLDCIVQPEALLEKVFEVLSVTSVGVQQDLISALPEIVEDSQHPQVATRLREVLEESNELCACVLEALSSLTLERAQVREARAWVLQSLNSAPLDQLPVTLKFLLHTVSNSDDALEVVTAIRKHIDLKSTTELAANSKQASNDRSTECLILDALKSAIRFQRLIAEAWIKCLDGVKVASEHGMLDLCVLLILHATNYKKAVETLIRNKLRAGLITVTLVQNTVQPTHSQLLHDYTGSILGLSEVLLRSPEPAVTSMAHTTYTSAFSTLDTYARQEIVGNLVTHIGSGVTGEVDASLSILYQLVHDHTTLMAPFTVFVKGVLDYLDNLSVSQIRKLYAMLSTLAFSPTLNETSMQDELHILIRKQLSNNTPKYKRMGVLGAIMVVKSLTRSTQPENALSDKSYRLMVDLLQLVTTSCRHCAHTSALFMDELSSLIASGDIHSQVEAWISDHVINCFQDDFIIDVEPETGEAEVGGLAMQKMFCLDDEADDAIAIHLPKLLIDSQAKTAKSRASPLCLSPTLRLLQICEKRQNEGTLDGIDALLGCAVYMPATSIADKLSSLSSKEKQLYCDSLFLLINWFREAINGFASQQAPEMKAKVLSRLQHITQLVQMLQAALAAYPTYTPVSACFDGDEVAPIVVAAKKTATKGKKGGKGKSKEKARPSDSDSDEENGEKSLRQIVGETNSQESQQTSQKSAATDTPVVDLNKYKPFFREFDLDVFCMLNIQQISHTALDTELNPKQHTDIQLQPTQLQFLLEDLAAKLQHALPAAAKRSTFLKSKVGKNVGFSHLDEKSAQQVAQQVVKLVPALCNHLQNTSAFFQALIEQNDGMLDGPGSTSPEALRMRECLHLLLQVLLSLFSWNGFGSVENRMLLKQALGDLASSLSVDSDTPDTSQTSLAHLVTESTRYLEKFGESVPQLSSAVTLCKLVACIASRSDDQAQLNQTKAALCGGFLKRDWRDDSGERAKGAKHNEHIQHLLKLYFASTENVLSTLEELSTVAVPELVEADKNGCSNTFSTLNRTTFAVFYRCMLTELVALVKTIAASKRTDSQEEKLEKLIRWNMAVKIFHALVSLIKVFDTRSNLNAMLKNGRQFVEIFLRQAMPLVDELFRAHKQDITGLLKNLQISTRAMHHMCGHSKIVRDVSLIAQVPLVKKCLETFVYRVKACLSLNNCLEAFWLGNLKNRDLKGEEIVSVTQASQDESRDSDDNLPSEAEPDSDPELPTGQQVAPGHRHLAGVPKALLPGVGGKRILDFWWEAIKTRQLFTEVYLVTNADKFKHYERWATASDFPVENIVNDGTTTSANRLGAVADLDLVLRSKAVNDDVMVVAGDMLFQDHKFDVSQVLTYFKRKADGDLAILYEMEAEESCESRGIAELQDSDNRIVRFLEKPSPHMTSSRLASVVFYCLRQQTLCTVRQYLDTCTHVQQKNFGKYMEWLINTHKQTVYGMKLPTGFQLIGKVGLSDYERWLDYFADKSLQERKQTPIVKRAYARIGLMGNPSDGFYGKTISMTIQNFWAEVTIHDSEKLVLVPHPLNDPTEFGSMGDLHGISRKEGYLGGLRLLQATCKQFYEYCSNKGIALAKRNFTLKYDTNIPRQVGLAGSSAIVTATLQCLMQFFNLNTSDMALEIQPQFILDVEKSELFINAGLQDRVIQVYEGLVYMDFSQELFEAQGHGEYERMELSGLPTFWLAYLGDPSDSGKIHSDVSTRWRNGDQDVIDGMKKFAELTEQAKAALESRDWEKLASLMDQNFDQRRSLYGDAALGQANLRMIELARQFSSSAKFPGSGGAVIGLCLEPNKMVELRRRFESAGYVICDVIPHVGGNSHNLPATPPISQDTTTTSLPSYSLNLTPGYGDQAVFLSNNTERTNSGCKQICSNTKDSGDGEC